MKQYAQVIDGIVEAILDIEKPPEYDIMGELIDITKLKNKPIIGWLFDVKNNFLPPATTKIISDALIEIDFVASQHYKQCSNVNWGQEAVYAAKIKDVNDYIADGSPTDLSKYQWLADEVEVTGASAKTISKKIKAKNEECQKSIRKIEQIRRNAKINIRKQKTQNAIFKIRDDAIKKMEKQA